MWENMYAEQLKESHLILCSSLIREKKWAASDDQNKGWTKEREGTRPAMYHVDSNSKCNSETHSLTHIFINKKQRLFLLFFLTTSASSSEPLSATAHVNLSTSCHWLNSAISFAFHLLFSTVPVRLFLNPQWSAMWFECQYFFLSLSLSSFFFCFVFPTISQQPTALSPDSR